MEFKNKNDYSFIVFDKDNNQICKIEFVHNCYKSAQWLTDSKNYNQWHYANIYNRRSGTFMKRIYKGNFIESYPK